MSRPIWPHGIAFFFVPRNGCRTCHGRGSVMGDRIVRGRPDLPPVPTLVPCYDCGGKAGRSAQVVLYSPCTPSGHGAERWR